MKLFICTLFLTLTSLMNALCYTPSVELQDGSKISGVCQGNLEAFKGIPFSSPPVGEFRFRPPSPYNKSLDGFKADKYRAQCYVQSPINLSFTDLPSRIINAVENWKALGDDGFELYGEDCLTVSVWRPAGVNCPDKLPVLFWIYAGGFSFGSVDMYDPSLIVWESIKMSQPVIVVSANYRSGAYGFLGGSEIVNEGSGNAGLLDQRLAMEWVADNIASFGGNPNDITIFGESAGAISVAHQLILFDGDINYKGKSLFHGAIMMSGSILPCDRLDSEYPQFIFDDLARKTGCEDTPDKLACMRELDPSIINTAQNVEPGFFGFHSVGLSFIPRPDGKTIRNRSFDAVYNDQIAQVPYIIGDQEDEGTVFALPLFNLTTSNDAIGYLKYLLPNATEEHLRMTAYLYPDDPRLGSPYRTGAFNQLYPEYKRIASYLGDVAFQWPRRFLLQNTPGFKKHSYLGRQFHEVPGVGTFHFGDTITLFYLNGIIFPSAKIYRQRWISFANHKDPNVGVMGTRWPEYSEGQENFIIDATSTFVESDDYRLQSSLFFNEKVHKGELLF